MPRRLAPRPAGATLEAVTWEPFVAVRPSDPVSLAREEMERHGVEGVVVVHPGGIPVASFGREQLQSPPLPRGVPPDQLPVGPYARRSRIVFTPQTTVRDALRALHRRGMPLAPVRRDGTFVGVVSRRRLEEQRRNERPTETPLAGRHAAQNVGSASR